MVQIRCVVEKITHQNPENDYTVLDVNIKDYDSMVTVVGNSLDVYEGTVLLIDGNWEADPVYNRKFVVEKWEEVMPSTIYEIEKYFGSGLIKGIGPHTAQKIVEKYGTDTISVFEENPENLSQVDGIGQKRAMMMKESWDQHKKSRDFMLEGDGQESDIQESDSQDELIVDKGTMMEAVVPFGLILMNQYMILQQNLIHREINNMREFIEIQMNFFMSFFFYPFVYLK